jgi:hypothetical protein
MRNFDVLESFAENFGANSLMPAVHALPILVISQI